MPLTEQMNQLPKRIEPCPLIEVACALRFDSSLPPDAVFGATFREMNKIAGPATPLGILRLPSNVRQTDPNLIDQPHYRYNKDGYATQIGPHLLSISKTGEYPGWDGYFNAVKARIDVMGAAGITNVTRMALRYINYFEADVFDFTKLAVCMDGKPFPYKTENPGIVFTIQKRFKQKVRIEKDVEVQFQGPDGLPTGIKRKGSIIDIDTFISMPNGALTGFDQFLQDAHNDEKELFYELVNDRFMQGVKANY